MSKLVLCIYAFFFPAEGKQSFICIIFLKDESNIKLITCNNKFIHKELISTLMNIMYKQRKQQKYLDGHCILLRISYKQTLSIVVYLDPKQYRIYCVHISM